MELAHVAGRTVATRAAASSPLKLLIPRRPGPAAWVYTSTHGGGLVAGDRIDLTIRLGPNSKCTISTQSSTKVYRNPTGIPCRQSLQAFIDQGATLVVAPDPVTCFAGAAYEQTQRFDIQSGGGLVLIDWLTSGRHACGERWAFSWYRSRFEVFLENDRLLTDALLLDPHHGPLDSPFRLGRFNCLAVIVMIGERFDHVSREILAAVGSKPLKKNPSLIEAVSPIRHGAIWKIVGMAPEQVGRLLHRRLDSLREVLGDVPWSRKW